MPQRSVKSRQDKRHATISQTLPEGSHDPDLPGSWWHSMMSARENCFKIKTGTTSDREKFYENSKARGTQVDFRELKRQDEEEKRIEAVEDIEADTAGWSRWTWDQLSNAAGPLTSYISQRFSTAQSDHQTRSTMPGSFPFDPTLSPSRPCSRDTMSSNTDNSTERSHTDHLNPLSEFTDTQQNVNGRQSKVDGSQPDLTSAGDIDTRSSSTPFQRYYQQNPSRDTDCTSLLRADEHKNVRDNGLWARFRSKGRHNENKLLSRNRKSTKPSSSLLTG